MVIGRQIAEGPGIDTLSGILAWKNSCGLTCYTASPIYSTPDQPTRITPIHTSSLHYLSSSTLNQPARSTDASKRSRPMNQPNHKSLSQLSDVAAKILSKLPNLAARVLGYFALVTLCAIPFILLHGEGKDFFYQTGAYGFYLIGVAQVLGRRM